MAYRRKALIGLRGFDERNIRSADDDLARRVTSGGDRIADGSRRATEIVRPRSWNARLARVSPSGTWHWLREPVRRAAAPPWHEVAVPPVAAVLLDRDGTLVADVTCNGDPDKVEALPGVRMALDRLRLAGVRLGVVTDQPGIACGLLNRGDVDAVNRRVDEMLGPFDVWQVCEHRHEDGCECRKPRPGMIFRAAAKLGVTVEHCVVVGDTGADVQAGLAAGASAVLVPTVATRLAEVFAGPVVCRTLLDGVDVILGARRRTGMSRPVRRWSA
jgi:histidinol-phosphate phosphatase family protein